MNEKSKSRTVRSLFTRFQSAFRGQQSTPSVDGEVYGARYPLASSPRRHSVKLPSRTKHTILDQQQSRFFSKLPLELRDAIYTEILGASLRLDKRETPEWSHRPAKLEPWGVSRDETGDSEYDNLEFLESKVTGLLRSCRRVCV